MCDAAAASPIDDLSIADNEKLLRRVSPVQVKTDGTPDTSCFKDDPGGIGTSMTVWRSPADLDILLRPRPDFGVIRVRALDLRAEGLGITFTPEDGNPNHVEVFGPRTTGKQKRVRAKAVWVKYPDGYPAEQIRGLDTFESND